MKKIISVLIVIILLCVCCASFVACKDVADNTEHFDTITKTLKLTKSYDDKSFLNDGIGEVTVAKYTDGDTSNFFLKKDVQTITLRYFGINTPESTGQVEKWGLAAKNFVHARLSQAKTVVLEATSGKATQEGHGRYLGYVWYNTEDDPELRNLNLEIVENGFSANNVSPTEAYYDYFRKANNFAKSIKLRWYSAKEDPLFADKAIEATIKDIWDDIENQTSKYYLTAVDCGLKVVFWAELSSVIVSTGSSPTYTFVATEYDEATNTAYSINVYAAYGTYSGSDMKVGHHYKIVGTIQKYNGKFQISGIDYVGKVGQNNNQTILLQENTFYIFESNLDIESTRDKGTYSDTHYSNLSVTSVDLTDGVLKIVGTANQIKSTGSYGAQEQFTIVYEVPEGYVNTIKVGDSITAKGFRLDPDKKEITICDGSRKEVALNY